MEREQRRRLNKDWGIFSGTRKMCSNLKRTQEVSLCEYLIRG